MPCGKQYFTPCIYRENCESSSNKSNCIVYLQVMIKLDASWQKLSDHVKRRLDFFVIKDWQQEQQQSHVKIGTAAVCRWVTVLELTNSVTRSIGINNFSNFLSFFVLFWYLHFFCNSYAVKISLEDCFQEHT